MNKKSMIIGGIIVFILLTVVVGIMFTVKFLSSFKEEVTEAIPTPTIVLPTVSENIIVELTSKNDNKAVRLKIKGITSDIDSIEYELTYLTGSGLPRGVLGKIMISSGETEITRDDIVLGTCSSGKCAYDTGVTSIDLSLKFNSSKGQTSVFRKTYSL